MTATVQCRQCGEPVPHDREGWATPMCHKCLPPIGAKRTMAEAISGLSPLALMADYSALFGGVQRPSPHPEGSSAEPAVAVPGAHIIDLGALLVGRK